MNAPKPQDDADDGDVPCVWVVASHRTLLNEYGHPQRYTLIDESGSRALRNLGLQPLSIPRAPVGRLASLLLGVDGVLLGGSATNIDPRHFGEEPVQDPPDIDHEREAVSLPLVRLCIEHRVPLIAFCRGAHEFNVAMGGSLHQDLRAVPHGLVHWESPEETLAQQYEFRHAVQTVPGGALAGITGSERFEVSSLHSQGVRGLAPGLVAEAHADDGLVEAFRWHAEDRYAWAFQFHPEWGHRDHPPFGRIMDSFVQACRRHFALRRGDANP
jgi:putative glutamine amidotransferase